jgi:RNA polymerase sigma factor (sigma-70 family)
MSTEELLVERARNGDRAALEELIHTIKDLVYNLAIRMLGNPADAEDATQEILIRVVTNLTSFRGESAFRTWVYRVASNQLLRSRVRPAERRTESFEAMGTRLEEHLTLDLTPLEDQRMVTEAKLFCTSGMLLCLDRDHRLAFILGEILELEGAEAASVLEIEPAAFRQRLSRARERMAAFMESHCGLVNARRPCRCGKQGAFGQKAGVFHPERLQWSTHPAEPTAAPTPTPVEELDHLARSVAVFRGHPRYVAPGAVVDGLRQLLENAKGPLLS